MNRAPSASARRRITSSQPGSPRSRGGLVALAASLVVLAGYGAGGVAAQASPEATVALTEAGSSGCTVSAILVPSCGIWWGATAGAGSDRTRSLADFESVSTSTDIYHAYHRLGQQFPTTLEVSLAHAGTHKRLLLLDFLPEGGHSWAQVANGASDAGIDTEARYIKSHFTDKFFMSIHHEPEEEVRATAGSGFTANDYRAMFRHVVQRFRSQGVNNIVYVMNYMGAPVYGVTPWFNSLYPGDDVVDWVAQDPYGCVSAKVCDNFANMMNRRFSVNSVWPGFYNWATANHPGKPMMLAEWGVFANQGTQAKTNFIKTVSLTLNQFPHLKAMVYFNSVSPRGDTLIRPGTPEATAMKQLASLTVFSQSVP